MTEELQAATPAEQEKPAEQVQTVETNSTEATTEQTEKPAEPQENKEKKEPWFQKRIGELTREKYEARRAAEEAQREAQQIREHLTQLQQGQQPDQRQLTQADIDRLADERAIQKLAERRLQESVDKVWTTGTTEFPDFGQAVDNLQLLGASRDFVELVTSFDASHKLIHHLGSNFEEADRILKLPAVQQARELTKLEMKLSQPVAKPVSNAPAPISPIAGAKGGSKDPSEMTDAEFAAWRRSQIAKRGKSH